MLRSGSLSSLDDPHRHLLISEVGVGVPELKDGLSPVTNTADQTEKCSQKSI